MTKLQDKLRAVKIHNDREFFGENPYIWLRIKGGSRDVLPSAYAVTKRGKKLDSAWHTDGDKWFSYSDKVGKAEAFEKAKSYMTEKFGITRLARSPFGGWGDADYIAIRLTVLLAEKPERLRDEP